MKKLYLAPTALTVAIAPMQMVAESIQIFSSSDPEDDTNTITNSNDILTKGSRSTWDSEW